MEKYKAIIYDIDGTLLDTLKLNMYPLMKIIKEETGEDWTFEQVLKFAAYPGMKVMEELGVKDQEKTYARWVQYVNDYEDGATLFEGFEEVLETFKNKKIKQEIVSSKLREQYEIDIVSKGIDQYMEAVILQDDTTFHKPHPEPLLKCIEKLVSIEKDWIPTAEGTSLYIRPFIFATDAHVGVHPGKHLMFMVICSPVGAYYPEGLNPVKIYVESKYVRAVRGGMGYAKTGGNYAASLKAQDEAEEQKYTQVLWLDGVERKYVEEVGTMNVFFVIGDEVVTPALQGSILPGVTRMSAIEILKSWGLNVSERPIEIQEIYDAYQNGQLKEAFGTGTAAVISPIGQLKWDDHVMEINNGKIGEISQRLYDTLTGIQWGNIEDTMHWTVEVK